MMVLIMLLWCWCCSLVSRLLCS